MTYYAADHAGVNLFCTAALNKSYGLAYTGSASPLHIHVSPMTLNTLIAVVFAFTSTGTRESDPEKGPETLNETSNVNRNLGTRVHNGDEEEADVEIDVLPPDESVSGLQGDPLQPSPVNSPDKHPSLFARAKSFIFPPSSDDLSYAPNYRFIPLITGIVIPFSILLEIPGLTGHWYIRTEDYNTVQTRPNPVLLDIGLAFSMTCAVLANICIILRFLEKRVLRMTVLCIVFLSIHGLCLGLSKDTY